MAHSSTGAPNSDDNVPLNITFRMIANHCWACTVIQPASVLSDSAVMRSIKVIDFMKFQVCSATCFVRDKQATIEMMWKQQLLTV